MRKMYCAQVRLRPVEICQFRGVASGEERRTGSSTSSVQEKDSDGRVVDKPLNRSSFSSRSFEASESDSSSRERLHQDLRSIQVSERSSAMREEGTNSERFCMSREENNLGGNIATLDVLDVLDD